MENKSYNAIIIDDHPIISEAYKNAFKHIENNSTISFDIETAVDCDSARDLINLYTKSKKEINIIFLDISIPASKDGKIVSGEDLGLLINRESPDSKIIVSTTFNDNYRMHNIIKNLNPDGFLIKNDITPLELVEAIQEVLKNPPYYSKTVTKFLRNQVIEGHLIDDVDRQILYQLSIGSKLKDLPEILHLSFPAIQKRKRQIANVLGLDNTNDTLLLAIAKEKGFL